MRLALLLALAVLLVLVLALILMLPMTPLLAMAWAPAIARHVAAPRTRVGSSFPARPACHRCFFLVL
jgi:hypothetical protein